MSRFAAFALLLLAPACAADPSPSASGRIDLQAQAKCASVPEASYDDCVAEEKRRLNASAIHDLSSAPALLTVPLAGSVMHH